MSLRHETDLTVADWFVRAGADALVRATQGPPGFAAYATVFFDQGHDDPYRPDPEVVTHLTLLAEPFTTTPDLAWFGLWDGWGDLHGGDRFSYALGGDAFGRIFRPRRREVQRPFGPQIMAAPRVELGGVRSYLLFRGAVSEVGRWGSRPAAPGWPVDDLPQASLTWPQDRAWFITSDVDPDWCTVAGPQQLIDAVLADPDLHAEPAVHGVPAPLREEA